MITLLFTTANAQETLFAGIIATEQTKTLDALLEYKQKTGLHIITEGIINPEGKTINLGLQSYDYNTFIGNMQVTAATDISIKNWGYIAYLQDTFADKKIRIGVLENVESLEGFAGITYKQRLITIDADVSYEETSENIQGYAAINPSKWFLSFGGNIREQRITNSIAYLNVHRLGFYCDQIIDLNDNEQFGKVFIANKLPIDRNTADFLAHLTNGTQMHGENSGKILDSWAPFDAYRTEHIGQTIRWNNTTEVFKLKAMNYFRPKKNIFLGFGFYDSYKKANNKHNPGLNFEIFTLIPKTPLETWVNMDLDLETREVNIQTYLGTNWDF